MNPYPVGSVKDLSYPTTKSEFEIQAELFMRLKQETTFDVRGEVPIYRKKFFYKNKYGNTIRIAAARPDIVLYDKKMPIVIIEVKRASRGKRVTKVVHQILGEQVAKYSNFVDYVWSCCGDSEIDSIVSMAKDMQSHPERCRNSRYSGKNSINRFWSEYRNSQRLKKAMRIQKEETERIRRRMEARGLLSPSQDRPTT